MSMFAIESIPRNYDSGCYPELVSPCTERYLLRRLAIRAAEAHLRAELRWGTSFDDKNSLNDWVVYAVMYATKAAEMGLEPDAVVDKLVKAAGLLLGAAERVTYGTIAPRHYDVAGLSVLDGEE